VLVVQAEMFLLFVISPYRFLHPCDVSIST
jgi:hypothetical protein